MAVPRHAARAASFPSAHARLGCGSSALQSASRTGRVQGRRPPIAFALAALQSDFLVKLLNASARPKGAGQLVSVASVIAVKCAGRHLMEIESGSENSFRWLVQ